MRRLLFIAAILLLAGHGQAWSQPANVLQEADSLFEANKFTESFKQYEYILEKERKASPAMLLRMAYIKEGLGDFSYALYYLNLYYLQTSDKRVLNKMEELAKKKALEGYSFNDAEFVKSLFFKYFDYLILALLALSIMMIAIMYYRKTKLHRQPLVSGILTVLILALFFYTINFGREYHKAIVVKPNTYLMNGPSAGADVIAIIGKGHRLPIDDQKDVWTTTEWKGKKAFVKTDKLKTISFFQ